MLTFKPLRKKMEEQNMNYTDLRNHGFSSNATTALKNDGSVRLETINKLCYVFNCNVEDIMMYIKEDEDDCM